MWLRLAGGLTVRLIVVAVAVPDDCKFDGLITVDLIISSAAFLSGFRALLTVFLKRFRAAFLALLELPAVMAAEAAFLL